MSTDIYRQEAVDHHAGFRTEGEVLLILPGWTRWTYRLLLGVVTGAFVFLAFGSVSHYAEGPAIIRADERLAVTAAQAGIVATVRVAPGMRVARGDVLVRFRSTDEEGQLASLQHEFDAALVRMLSNPLDQAARQAVGALRAQRELLDVRLGERVLRAPEAGRVGDVRVRPGQNVTPGELVASIARDQASFSVLALLPGQQRPELRPGMPLRLEITGHAYAYQTLTIDRIDDEVVGPYEVRRMLGPEISDSIPVAGPVVLVRARLADTGFVSAGRRYGYFDGMHGAAQAKVRSERLVTVLLPGLKALTESSR